MLESSTFYFEFKSRSWTWIFRCFCLSIRVILVRCWTRPTAYRTLNCWVWPMPFETQMNNDSNYAHNITNAYQMKSMYTVHHTHILNIECGALKYNWVEYYLTDCWISPSSICTNQMENLILSIWMAKCWKRNNNNSNTYNRNTKEISLPATCHMHHATMHTRVGAFNSFTKRETTNREWIENIAMEISVKRSLFSALHVCDASKCLLCGCREDAGCRLAFLVPGHRHARSEKSRSELTIKWRAHMDTHSNSNSNSGT